MAGSKRKFFQHNISENVLQQHKHLYNYKINTNLKQNFLEFILAVQK
jgi:hypothetical protein